MALELEVWQAPIVDNEGNIQPGAQVTVFNSDDTIATIYDDLDRTPRSNPFNVGSDALARFYAEPGRYRVQAQVGSDIAVFDNVDVSQKAHRLDLDKPESGIPQAIQLRGDLESSDPAKGAALIRRGVVAVDSIADMLALPASARRADLRVDVAGRNAGENIGGGQYLWDSSSEKRDNGDTVLAVSGVSVGRWIKISGQISEDLQILIPTDYPSLHDAILDLCKFIAISGVKIDLLIESGHQLTRGFSVNDGNYSFFVIKSVDSIVYLSPSFEGFNLSSLSDSALFAGSSAVMPVLGCLVDADSLCDRGYMVSNNSTGRVLGGCGVRRSSEFGLAVSQSSRCRAVGADFQFSARGNRVTTSSHLNAEGANFSNSTGIGYAPADVFCLDVSRGSTCYFMSQSGRAARAENSAGRGISMRRSYVVATGAVADNAALDGIRVELTSNCEAQGISVNNCGKNGASVYTNSSLNMTGGEAKNSVANGANVLSSSTLDASGVDFSGASSNCVSVNRNSTANIPSAVLNDCTGGGGALSVSGGSRVNAKDVTILNATGRGCFSNEISHVNLEGATIQGSGDEDVRIDRGSVVCLQGATTTDSAEPGQPSASNTNVATFNNVNLRGIIFA